jgi:hypothetical protein
MLLIKTLRSWKLWTWPSSSTGVAEGKADEVDDETAEDETADDVEMLVLALLLREEEVV